MPRGQHLSGDSTIRYQNQTDTEGPSTFTIARLVDPLRPYWLPVREVRACSADEAIGQLGPATPARYPGTYIVLDCGTKLLYKVISDHDVEDLGD